MSHDPLVTQVHRLFPAGPGDVSGLAALLDEGAVRAEDIVCVIGKTEGNGGRNDFTRELCSRALADLLGARLGITPAAAEDRVIFSLSGGTEGVVTPHLLVFSQRGALADAPLEHEGRLVLASGHTRPFDAHEIGRLPQVEETARVVRDLLDRLHVPPTDVHLVQIKGAIPDPGTARSNMVYSRGASALGVALALGEIPPGSVHDDAICADFALYSGVASVSAKPGLRRSEILLFANSRRAGGDLRIDHGVLRDLLDTASVRAVLARLGLPTPHNDQLDDAQRARLRAVFAKSEADPRGLVRGRRHTMLSDDDISDTRYSRCVLAAVLASITGDPAVYVSTRAEHHGPLGGGPVAIIASVN